MANTYNLSQKAISRQCLIEAMVDLVAREKIGEISVSELCRRAGTSRMAFYRNFDSISDVLQSVLEDHVNDLLDRFNSLTAKTWKDLGLMFLDFVENRRSVFQAVVDAGLTSLLTDLLASGIKIFNNIYFSRSYATPEEAFYAAEFEAGGLMSIILKWFERDCRDSRELIATFLLKQAGIPGDEIGVPIRKTDLATLWAR